MLSVRIQRTLALLLHTLSGGPIGKPRMETGSTCPEKIMKLVYSPILVDLEHLRPSVTVNDCACHRCVAASRTAATRFMLYFVCKRRVRIAV